MREFEDGERNIEGMVREEKIGGVTRREFLELGVAATLAAGAGEIAWAADTKSEVPRRTLGRTGEKVSMVGLGGYHIGSQKDEQESIRIIRTALDSGINFLDNCGDCRRIASICCNFTRLFAWKIRTACLQRAAEWKRRWKRRKRERCATSDSPG